MLKWPKKVIQQISNVLRPGIKFYHGHNEDNSTQGRKSIGSVVSTFLKNIAGKLSNVVVGHFPEGSDYDVISMEADINVEETDQSNVESIANITGIAAASSNTESPAFPGARLMASIQCFEENEEPKNIDEVKEMSVTIEDVKKFVRERHVHPNELYQLEDLKNDRVFSKEFDKISTLEADKERLENEKKEIQERSKDAVNKIASIDGRTMLDKALTKENGYTDLQIKFIKNRYETNTIEDYSEEGIKSFIDGAKKDFSKNASIFGVETGDQGDLGGLPKPGTDKDPVDAAVEALT